MSTLSLDQIAGAVIAAFPKLSSPEQRVSLALYRLLAKGQPATAEHISNASGVSRDDVGEMLARWHGVQRRPDGAVTAFWGLTLSKTKHQFRVEGRDLLHTWCAWDTLFLPPLLGATAEVDSVCPASGERIALTVGPRGIEAARPETAVLSFLMPNEDDIQRDVIDTFCCHVHFFASRQAAENRIGDWPGTFVLSLGDGWQVGLRKNSAQFSSIALPSTA